MLRPIYKLYWFERAEINEIHNQKQIWHPTSNTDGSMLIAKMHVPPERTKLLRNRYLHDQII